MKKILYNSKIILLAKIALGLILLYVVYTRFDLTILQGLQVYWSIFAVMLLNSLLITALRGVKWSLILTRMYNKRIPYKRIFNLMVIGQFFAFFTPSRVGDLGRAKYLKEDMSLKKSFSSVLIDKIFDIMAIGFFAVLGFIYMGDKLFNLLMIHFNIAVPLLTVFLVSALLIAYFFREKINEFTQLLFEFEKKTERKVFIDVLLLSLIVWFLTYIQFYLAMLMINESAIILDVFMLASVYTVILLLPISINGLGVREGTAAVLFPLINIPVELGVVVAWIVALNNSVFPAVLGYISMLREK